MNKNHANDLSNIVEIIQSGLETLSKKYNQALEEMANKQLETWKAGMVDILEKSNGEITALLNITERKILENSDSDH